MKNIKLLLLILITQYTLINCQEKTSEETIIYEVTPEFAKSIDKPEIYFSVEIPTSLKFNKPEPNKKNSSYGMIQKINDKGQVEEMYSFGYLKFDGMGSIEKEGIDFLKQIKSMLSGAGYQLEDTKLGFTKFDDNTYTGMQLAGTMKEGLSDLFEGRYYFNIIITPNPDGNVHIMHLMAVKDNLIDNYNDFADKLIVSKLWQSFNYK